MDQLFDDKEKFIDGKHQGQIINKLKKNSEQDKEMYESQQMRATKPENKRHEDLFLNEKIKRNQNKFENKDSKNHIFETDFPNEYMNDVKVNNDLLSKVGKKYTDEIKGLKLNMKPLDNLLKDEENDKRENNFMGIIILIYIKNNGIL